MSSADRLAASDPTGPASSPVLPPSATAAAERADAEAERRVSGPAGLAHVSALSFLASRAAPSGAFVLALAGGVALARAGERFGWRRGYGASLAAMIQTVAYLGPARLNGPLTQALTAPVMGALERRGVGALGQFAACFAGRMLHNTVATAFFVFVLLGGLDAYAGTYNETFGDLALLPSGPRAALAFTAVSLVGWAIVATIVQIAVYRRGMRRWPDPAAKDDIDESAESGDLGGRGRFDPRAVALAAAVAFTLLVASTAAPLLAGVGAWLFVAWLLSRPDRRAVPTGVALALLIGGGSLVFSLVGGLGLAVGLQRGARAMLIVLVATWLRAAARSDGIREVARRSLGRLRRIPSVPEAVSILDELGAEARLAPSGRALLAELRSARKRPVAMVDAVLGWVAGESGRFRAGLIPPPARLRVAARDVALVAAAAAPVLTLLLG
ncbi:MAG: hypothetical protein H0T96_00300 [Thermoleophilaceae bacterium]|jgi:hypothetical protein|nr:hypothetical protein [Thermoleophilaceae bacterium]MDQ3241268.1 hypothetical protein [Actinomycetota bacterium]